MRNYRIMTALMAASMLAVTGSLTAQQRTLGFRDGGWELTGDAEFATVDGLEAIRIRTGFATRKDVVLQDGTIDFDVKMTRHRSFVYILFRMTEGGEHEEIYLRPHKSALPDAIQYNPVFQGRGQWQIYHGPGATAAVEFAADEWTHVRLVLQGRHAALFVGDTTTPAMVMPRLVREPTAGYVALRSFLPGGQPVGVFPAVYSDVTVRPGFIPFDFSTIASSSNEETPEGMITTWSVSKAFVPGPGAVLELPESIASGAWQSIETEPTGLALLIRSVRLPPRAPRVAAAARITVQASQATTRSFNFGYSDEVSVFLNGRLLYSADDRYSFDAPRREGLIGLDMGTLYLPLQAGANDLVLVVSDSFGGWGVMGQLPDRQGLRVVAR